MAEPIALCFEHITEELEEKLMGKEVRDKVTGFVVNPTEYYLITNTIDIAE